MPSGTITGKGFSKMGVNKLNLSGVSASTVARTAVLVLALVNQVLTSMGKPVISVADEDVNALISSGITVVAALIAWWKNNSVTEHAQAADVYMRSLKIDRE